MGIGGGCFDNSETMSYAVVFNTSGGREGGPGRGGDSLEAVGVQQIDSVMVVVNSLMVAGGGRFAFAF